MAVTGLYYHLEVKNAERLADGTPNPQQVHVRIYDRSLEDDTTIDYQVIELTGSGDPFHTSTIDNSEDKFAGIQPTAATIVFLSTNQINLATFDSSPIPTGGTDPGDPRWRVVAYLNEYTIENTIFEGFLNLDDCYEAFLPEKNEVILVANDGLGGLQNIPLTDFNGNNPKGYNRIADYLTWALSKTGLRKKLNVVFNIREKSKSTQHFFDSVYLDAKTFEDKIGTCINCFEAIERIIGDEADLTQVSGEWFIMRLDELAGDNSIYRAVFDEDGNFETIVDESTTYNRIIFKESSVFFSQEATTVHPRRPHKFIKETYQFEYPQEIVDNIDFSRGEFINFNHATKIAKYQVADWMPFQPTPATHVLGEAYIQRLFEDTNMTYEKERFLVIDGNSSDPASFFLQSNRIPISKLDKVQVSFDVRYASDISGSGNFWRWVGAVLLYGNDGSLWMCGTNGVNAEDKDGWELINTSIPAYILTGPGIWTYQRREDFQNEWASVSCATPPAPVDGEMTICLINHQDITFPRHFTNLQFTYIPFINGSYSKYSGYHYKVYRDINYINTREKQVYVSDGAKKLFKGGLFKLNSWTNLVTAQALFEPPSISGSDNRIVLSIPTGDVRYRFPVGYQFRVTGTSNNNRTFTTTAIEYSAGSTIIHVAEDITIEGAIPTATFQRPHYELTNEFYSFADFQTTTPDTANVHPYAWLQAYDVWNQHRNRCVKFQATLQGLVETSALKMPHLINRWFLNDANENTNERRFMLLSYDIDWYSCEWRAVLIEIYNESLGKTYLDNLEVKYEQ